MAEVKEPWFVTERSEAMAALLLTNLEDVEIVSQQKRDNVVDLVVGLDRRPSPQRGCSSSRSRVRSRRAQPIRCKRSGHLFRLAVVSSTCRPACSDQRTR